MRTSSDISKSEALKRINDFFSRGEFGADEMKKIKKLAMKFNIRLGKMRERFCKKCYSDLRGSKIRVGKKIRIVTCQRCGYANRTANN